MTHVRIFNKLFSNDLDISCFRKSSDKKIRIEKQNLPNDRVNGPLRTTFSSKKQWAAVKTCCVSIRVPPQMCWSCLEEYRACH